MPEKEVADNHLYLKLRMDLCRKIFDGTYQDGELFPPERELASQFGVSRVTIRKTLELLENERYISRVQGSGTRVALRTAGYPGGMDILALVAPAQNSFFASFIDFFESFAESSDSLVLFKQARSSGRLKIEDYLFRLFQKNIRDVILWLPGEMIEAKYLQRLRGMGMNIVFFDVVTVTPFADCVSVDNCHAIESLYKFVTSKGHQNMLYLGWDNHTLSSVREREKAFQDIAAGQRIHRLAWDQKEMISKTLAGLICELEKRREMPGCFICGDGEIGIGLQKILAEKSLSDHLAVCVDDLPEARELRLTVYAQPLQKLARQVYECLCTQNRESGIWRASNYYVKGELIIR
jgi:DNA-binding LacI/PurR family transcriptional regulator